MLAEMEEERRVKEETNINPYTFKYCIQNKLGGCHLWASPNDRKWFGEHI
jgi:large subunit ribosomal protein L16